IKSANQAIENVEYVRRLLEQKQPRFAASLECAVSLAETSMEKPVDDELIRLCAVSASRRLPAAGGSAGPELVLAWAQASEAPLLHAVVRPSPDPIPRCTSRPGLLRRGARPHLLTTRRAEPSRRNAQTQRPGPGSNNPAVRSGGLAPLTSASSRGSGCRRSCWRSCSASSSAPQALAGRSLMWSWAGNCCTGSHPRFVAPRGQ